MRKNANDRPTARIANHGPVVLVAVGDLMLGDSAISTGYGFASRYSSLQSSEAVARLGRVFDGADIVFGNLECVLSDAAHDRGEWTSTQMRGHPFYARLLSEVGFTVLSVANNHTYQHGARAFFETVEGLSRVGISCCGLRGSGSWTSKPVVVSRRAIAVGFLAYSLRPRQYRPETPPYAEGTPAGIFKDIQMLRSQVDHVVVSLHWGEEYVDRPSESEVRLGRSLIEAGASVLLGHHPHVPRPVERWGHGIIAYSLGNFVSDMIWYSPLRSAAVVSMELDGGVRDVTVRSMQIRDTYLPDLKTMLPGSTAGPSDHGMPEAHYRGTVERTVRDQRLASYWHALKNVPRFRSPTLRQLILRTLGNKVSAARQRFRRTAFHVP